MWTTRVLGTCAAANICKARARIVDERKQEDVLVSGELRPLAMSHEHRGVVRDKPCDGVGFTLEQRRGRKGR